MAERDKTRNILQRLHAVMEQVSYIQKEKKQGMRYSIVTHDAVTALVRRHFVEHGILYWISELDDGQVGNRTRVRIAVRFQNIDDKDDYILVPSLGYGVDDQDKGPGKGISYAVKYAILKTLGLETGDDPDTEQSEKANFQPDDPAERPASGMTKAQLLNEIKIQRQRLDMTSAQFLEWCIRHYKADPRELTAGVLDEVFTTVCGMADEYEREKALEKKEQPQ